MGMRPIDLGCGMDRDGAPAGAVLGPEMHLADLRVYSPHGPFVL